MGLKVPCIVGVILKAIIEPNIMKKSKFYEDKKNVMVIIHIPTFHVTVY